MTSLKKRLRGLVPTPPEIIRSALARLVVSIVLWLSPIILAVVWSWFRDVDPGWFIFAGGVTLGLLLYALTSAAVPRLLRRQRYQRLIAELLAAAETLSYPDHRACDAFRRRGQMILEKVYGPNSRALIEFLAIYLVSSAAVDMYPEETWESGKTEYINHLKTLLEEFDLP